MVPERNILRLPAGTGLAPAGVVGESGGTLQVRYALKDSESHTVFGETFTSLTGEITGLVPNTAYKVRPIKMFRHWLTILLFCAAPSPFVQ